VGSLCSRGVLKGGRFSNAMMGSQLSSEKKMAIEIASIVEQTVNCDRGLRPAIKLQ